MANDFVRLKGEKYHARVLVSGNFGLDLSFKEINDITEIKGLENLTHLHTLDLSGNPIKEDERHLLEKSAHEVVWYCRGFSNKPS